MDPKPSRDFLLPASILTAGILISGSIIYVVGAKSGPAAPAAPQDTRNAALLLTALQNDAVLGPNDAPVTIIEYGDYQCPFCGAFFEEVELVVRDRYVKAGDAKLIFRNFQFLGSESFAAGEAAECARDQGQFWAFHDGLYRAEIADGKANNGNLNANLFLKIAREVGLDEGKFASCVAARKHRALVEQETAEGRQLGVNATPTTFVNGLEIRGLAPNDTRVIDAIEAALRSNR
jgi:protein-disulfide isomerase